MDLREVLKPRNYDGLAAEAGIDEFADRWTCRGDEFTDGGILTADASANEISSFTRTKKKLGDGDVPHK
jgi:hypothetical protein